MIPEIDAGQNKQTEPLLLQSEPVGSGPPLIILHGFLGSGENWRTLSRVFGAHFSVYTPDLRNHGHAPHHEAMDYRVMMADVIRFMDHRHLPTAHLLGHSMGGKVAMQCAFGHPDRINRLVVADITPRAYPPHHTALLAALAGLDLDAVDSRKAAGAALASGIPDMTVRQFLLKNLTLNPETRRYRWRINLPVLRAQYAAINAPLDPDAHFEGPTLFIRGGRSGYVQDTDWPTLQRMFPAARLETLPDAGHWVHADAPQAFADLVLGFLSTDRTA